MGRRPIGPVDTIWLNMDRPNNLMVIDSLMFFDGQVDWDRARAVVERRLVDRYPVFSQRPVQPPLGLGTPHWEDDPDFDLERHFRRVHLARGDDATLQGYIEQFMAEPMDRTRPLWVMHLLDGYDGGSVVYTRIHHSLADGIALNQVLLSLTDATPEGDLDESEDAQEEVRHSRGLLGEAVHLAGSAASGAAHLLLDLPRLLDPHLVGDAFTQAERTGGIANKLLLGPRPRGPLTGAPGVAKRAVWSEAFPLGDIKHIGHRTGTTVNDVLMGCIAGALAGYTREHGGEPEDVSTMVPVNVRPLDEPLPRELGNQFALVLFKYPSSLPTPLERIVETHRRMEVIKHSPEVVLTFGLIKAIGRTGPDLERFLVDFFAAKAIGVTTNVPGPLVRRYIAGTPIKGILAWVPESGDQTVGVSIFTYAGTVRVGFKVDAARVRDPESLVHAFDEEVAQLLRLAHAV
ncbi:MAG TPA: wax ester/triacylglycerol synthase family O-acyltransferase [Nocardioidaceae bacterium]|jgi:WS/DGAT/MGAT family acyltransferase